MRKKWFISLLMVTILGVAAGAHLVSRTNAQDPPKKAEPAEKEDLFEALKKALQEKKDVPLVPSPAEAAPLALPPTGAVQTPVKPVAPPSVPTVPAPAPTQDVVPPPVSGGTNPLSTPPAFPSQQPTPPTTPLPRTTFPAPGVANDPLPTPKAPLPAVTDQGPKPDLDIPPLQKPSTPPLPTPRVAEPPPPPTVQVTPVQAKDSPWSLHVDMIDGQTIVTATVNKKHEFKIVCQTLDLQTGKNTLKATGKVQITGEMLTGSCDHLAIPLMDDRLVLEGSAQVAIQKVSANVSTEKAASFELKGSTLDLRISELQLAKVPQTGLQQSVAASGSTPVRTVSMSTETKKWTPYGKLRNIKSLDSPARMWSLESSTGEVIAYLTAREGGTLQEYVGRTISVLGLRESDHGGQPVLRVTHIALP